jgi:glycosyltransferase involved in cell wall biosynthesis
MPYPTCSVLVTTYNRPAALERCVVSLFQQTCLPDEIIVCDDGSSVETQQLVEHLQAGSPVPLRYVWQPDEGFRLARIRNIGLAVAKNDYIIQLDGDVIVHRHYVADHLRHAQPGFFFSGNQHHIPLDIARYLLDNPAMPVDAALRQSEPSWRRFWSPPLQKFMVLFYHWETHYQYVLGCNMAFWREDLVRVNGYDEQFRGWGWEDTDLSLRLINAGCMLRFIRFGAIQYHLDHPIAPRDQEENNRERAMETIEQKRAYCASGMAQYAQLASSPAGLSNPF